MQLFITDEMQISNEKIIISEKRIINQLKKVLRAKPGYKFFIQHKTYKNIQKRYYCEILEIKETILAKVLEVKEKQIILPEKWVICSILNKFDKMELIVQKLTELAVPIIWFVPTSRSIFKKIPPKKLERFYKILLEATEQSFWWFLPQIKIYNSLDELPSNTWILNFNWKSIKNLNVDFLLIWPEWWFTEKDIEKIKPKDCFKLTNTVLRSETASILAGYELVKNL